MKALENVPTARPMNEVFQMPSGQRLLKRLVKRRADKADAQPDRVPTPLNIEDEQMRPQVRINCHG